MSYREFMMCKWKLDYRDSKVGCSKSMLDYNNNNNNNQYIYKQRQSHAMSQRRWLATAMCRKICCCCYKHNYAVNTR